METQRQSTIKGGSKVKAKRPSMYNVVMLNDDFTPMDFVVWALETHFNKSRNEATDLMLQVHHGKKAVIGTFTYDIAVTKSCKVIYAAREKGYPFKVIVDKV